MGIVTTHSEGRVVTHASDGALPQEVVQLPARDAAVQGAAPPEKTEPAKPTAAVKAATKQRAARVTKAKASAPTKRKK